MADAPECDPGPDGDGDGLRDDFELTHDFDPMVPGEEHEDPDGDGWDDAGDNCPQDSNPDQRDMNGDGVGDACQCRHDASLRIPGDAKGNGRVDDYDYASLKIYWGRTDVGFTPGDFNCDGRVEGADCTIWADHFGETSGGAY